MSAVLVQEVNRAHRPIYYVSVALQGVKTQYIELGKVTYALLTMSHKLRHYFMAYEITVPSSYPLNTLLHNKNATGCIGKWVAELAPSNLKFVARTAIKLQTLTDFVAEWTSPSATSEPQAGPTWTLYTDR